MGPYDPPLAAQLQHRGRDKSSLDHAFGFRGTRVERLRDRPARKRAHGNRHRQVAEIAVRIEG